MLFHVLFHEKTWHARAHSISPCTVHAHRPWRAGSPAAAGRAASSAQQTTPGAAHATHEHTLPAGAVATKSTATTMDSPSPTSTSTAASQPRAGTQSPTVVHPTVQVRVNGSGVHNPEMRSAGAGAGGGFYYDADVPGDGTCFYWSVVVLETTSAAAAGRQPRWVFLALVFGGVETLGASACGSATVWSRSVCPGMTP